jgi:hypothetical protein
MCRYIVPRRRIEQEADMVREMSLLLGIAALGAIAIATTADARDGCGPGRYYNGYRCVPEPFYEPQPRYYAPQQRYYGPQHDSGPGLLFQFGGRNEPQYFPPSRRRFDTFNGCPPRYTVQDGLCKPYTGR